MSDEKLYLLQDDTGIIPESEWSDEMREYFERMQKEIEEKYKKKYKRT